MSVLELLGVIGVPVSGIISAFITARVTAKETEKNFTLQMQKAAQEIIEGQQEQINELFKRDKECKERNDRLEAEIQQLRASRA